MMDERFMVTPTELRQFHYCPRVLFFERCTPVQRRETRRMGYGRENHDCENRLERERSLGRYGLLEGERRFSVRLHAPRLGLTGEADLIVLSGEEVYPIEFKDSTRAPDLGHKMQLCAYGLMLEAVLALSSPRGFWHSTRTGETISIEFDKRLRNQTLKAVQEIQNFVALEHCPEPTAQIAKCMECELKNFCGDTL